MAQADRARRVPRPERESGGRGNTALIVATLVALALVLALVALYARGGGPVPGWLSWLGPDTQGLLEPSGPEEAVLRTLRLAGYDQAVVGEADGVVVVRLDVPHVGSPADIELSWQTVLGAALGAYPSADRYVAQVFSRGESLLEVGVDGVDLRGVYDGAVELDEGEDPATGLKRLADIVFLSGEGIGSG